MNYELGRINKNNLLTPDSESLNKTVLMVMVAMLALVWLAVRSIICVNLPLILNPVEKVWGIMNYEL